MGLMAIYCNPKPGSVFDHRNVNEVIAVAPKLKVTLPSFVPLFAVPVPETIAPKVPEPEMVL